MIPFSNCWPYDIVREDVYVQHCPFCPSQHILLPIKSDDVKSLYGGARKITLVFPCCHSRLRIIDADGDYLLSNRVLRRNEGLTKRNTDEGELSS
ncbi:MAG: hypothetical protein P0Y55_12755 [Candidatus Cohnella colombiensis]|uniref:Uncharacterized protein n=1 Tax=Candidatus Cohnella colombiensis TaxID=3121368 RepID=A0AA95EY31_9BACL|nr:MAG: hypothetical protein P0Y55_12755 [Cohnella sp.]